MLYWLLHLLSPPRCVLCKQFLAKDEMDLCRQCRKTAPLFKKPQNKLSFVAGWTALWYYKDTVRGSILRYKFYGKRHYAPAYGRLLSVKLLAAGLGDLDTLTLVPIAPLRRFTRGYDQVELLTNAVLSPSGHCGRSATPFPNPG